METKADIKRWAVLAAIQECDALGRDAFLAKHGYRRSKRFALVHEGREYDSKAILGVAFGYQHRCAPLRSKEHSGGAEHCARQLNRLGFEVREGGSTFLGVIASIGRRVVRAAMVFVAATNLAVGLVGCTKSKLPHPATAGELYKPSWVFTKSLEYLEPRCDSVHVLSAKHHLVDLDVTLEPYDETLAGARKHVVEAWAEVVRAQIKERWSGERVRFILMAGGNYATALEGLEDAAWLKAVIERPLAGLGTGYIRQWLKKNV